MIDWDRIAELKNDVLCDDFAEVFVLFLEEVEEVLSRLRHAPQFATFEEDFHFLKGSAINLGFADFAELCAIAERAAANGAAMSVDVDRILDAYDVSIKTFMARADEFGLAA